MYVAESPGANILLCRLRTEHTVLCTAKQCAYIAGTAKTNWVRAIGSISLLKQRERNGRNEKKERKKVLCLKNTSFSNCLNGKVFAHCVYVCVCVPFYSLFAEQVVTYRTEEAKQKRKKKKRKLNLFRYIICV